MSQKASNPQALRPAVELRRAAANLRPVVRVDAEPRLARRLRMWQSFFAN
jgi:hypothetical protein